jgi:hypothetical protein
MYPFAEIGGWQIVRVLLSTLPEITLWVVVLGALGLALGVATLMASLRWMLPWASLHKLRQGRRGWVWVILQWAWVILWGISLPALSLLTGALSGTAFGAQTLIHRESVGQVIGERILGPICFQIALQLQTHFPKGGDLTHSKLEAQRIRLMLETISPDLLDSALKKVPLLDDSDPKATPMEQTGRRFARQAVERAAQSYFDQKARFATSLLRELEKRGQVQASLQEVVCCASHLYFTPAFARWTFWWILAHAAALLPCLAAVWLTPWLLFQLFWHWQHRGTKSGKVAHPEFLDTVSGV